MSKLPSNYIKAIKWIDQKLSEPNKYNLDLGNGEIIIDLHKCLDVKKERLINLSGYCQKIVFLQTKLIKDYLNEIE